MKEKENRSRQIGGIVKKNIRKWNICWRNPVPSQPTMGNYRRDVLYLKKSWKAPLRLTSARKTGVFQFCHFCRFLRLVSEPCCPTEHFCLRLGLFSPRTHLAQELPPKTHKDTKTKDIAYTKPNLVIELFLGWVYKEEKLSHWNIGTAPKDVKPLLPNKMQLDWTILYNEAAEDLSWYPFFVAFPARIKSQSFFKPKHCNPQFLFSVIFEQESQTET